MILTIFTLLAWAFALTVSHVYPVLLGTAVVAYTLGLRHAVDADHLAAIDNATRKLMQDGQKPITVGLFFSLGHSSVVVLATVVIAFAASALESHLQSAKAIGGLIGASVSAAFLFAIAFANVLILMAVFRAFQRVKNGEPVFEEDLDIMLANFGILRRVFKPIFGVIRSSWHLFPIGFLFGLGFDTATEIGVLGISAAGAAEGLPILVDPGLSSSVHGGNDLDRHHQQHSGDGRIRLGFRETYPEALLQYDHHIRIGCHRLYRRRHRSAWRYRQQTGPAPGILGPNRDAERQF